MGVTISEYAPEPGSSVEIPEEGRTLSTGVGLKESELKLVDQIADQLRVARNSILRYAIRHFLKEYLSGRIDLAGKVETTERRRLNMP